VESTGAVESGAIIMRRRMRGASMGAWPARGAIIRPRMGPIDPLSIGC
jgi:hypothetical protein